MNRPKMRIDTMKVTPDQATRWLEGNTHNRSLLDSVVHRYAHDMKAGRWGLTHQGIAFSEDMTLLDGQHRLWAVIEAGVPVEMIVLYNVPEESLPYLDGGRPRTVVEVLKLADAEANVSNFRVAVARRMLVGARTQVITSRQELIAFLERHAKALDFTIEEVLQKKKVLRVMPAPVAAAVARASYTENRDRLKEFGAILLGDMPKGPNDAGAHLLRTWLLSGAQVSGLRVSRELLIYTKAQRGLVAFLRGEQMRNLYPAKDEVWPLPDENRRRRA